MSRLVERLEAINAIGKILDQFTESDEIDVIVQTVVALTDDLADDPEDDDDEDGDGTELEDDEPGTLELLVAKAS